jgi:hypothetical protein
MSVNQNFINDLAVSVKGDLFAASELFVKRANNSIINNKLSKDVIRLRSLLYILENYNVDTDYFDEDYILKIEGEYSNHCGYKKTTTVSFTSGGQEEGFSITTYNKEMVYEHTSDSLITTNNGATGILLDKTPQLALDVYIDGVPMMIGDGSKTKDIYFSSDGGTTAKTILTLAEDDEMFYNAVIVGTSLLTTAVVRLEIL